MFRSLRRTAPFVLCLALGQLGCKGASPEPQTSSETHFLERCDGSCEAGMSCLCGVCTRACTGSIECSGLSSQAQCVSVVERPDAGREESCRQGATCDMACVTHADCQSLGSDYRCDTGFCRRGELICPSPALTSRDEVRELVVGGVNRTYLLHVPSSYTGKSAVPLVSIFIPWIFHPIGNVRIRASWSYRICRDSSQFGPQGSKRVGTLGCAARPRKRLMI